MSSTNSSNGRRPPSVEFHSTSANLWSRNPLTSLFRRSKRKEEKHRRVERDAEVNAKEDERKQFDKTRHRPKRSSSCDALSHGRFGTRFDVTADGAEMSSGTLQRDATGRSTRRRKRSGGDRLQQQQQQQQHNNNQQDISLCSTDPAHSSSFSSLLHQRIFLCSRGASPFVPFFYQKSAKTKCSATDHFDRIEIEGKKQQQQKASRSHQNISRLIRDESSHRRDHSLDSSKVPSCVVRAVPIVRIPFTSSASSSTIDGTAAPFPLMGRHHRHLYERREEFFHRRAQCQQNGAKMSWDQRAAEVEEWMQTQPISLRKLEQHERLRLMVAGGRFFGRGGGRNSLISEFKCRNPQNAQKIECRLARNKSQTLRVLYCAKVPMKSPAKFENECVISILKLTWTREFEGGLRLPVANRPHLFVFHLSKTLCHPPAPVSVWHSLR